MQRDVNQVADWLASVALHFPLGIHVLPSPFGDCHRLLSLDLAEGIPAWSTGGRVA